MLSYMKRNAGFLVLIVAASQYGNGQSQANVPDNLKCAIGGHVTNMLTGTPLKKATIRLIPAGRDAEVFASATMSTLGFGSTAASSYSTVSEADGSFCFADAKAGQYTLSGNRPGFLKTNYGARTPTESGQTVIVTSGSQENLALALVPQGVVSGRVIDEDGEPVSGAFVHLLMRVWVSSQFRIARIRGVQSNDLGEFRVAGVSQGTYYVLVEPKAENPATAVSNRRLLRTFAPGVAGLAGATPIVIQAGEERSGVDIQLLSGQTHHVRGRLLGLSAMDRGGLTLSPEGEEQLFIGAGAGNRKADGTFDFPAVAPGNYTLSYVQVTGQDAKGGRRSIEVGDQDVNDVMLAVTKPASIRGHLEIENTPSKNSGAGDFHRLHMALVAVDALVGPTASATVSEDGSFTIQNIITPGRYLVRCDPPTGMYVKSVRYGQTELTGKELELLDGSSGEMDVILRYGPAALTGRIDEPEGTQSATAQLPLAHIVVVPDSSGTSGRGVILGSAGVNGAFSISQVPPGHYRVYAFESVDFAALHEPAVLKALETLSTEIDLKEGDEQSLSLRLIPASEEQRLVRLGRGE